MQRHWFLCMKLRREEASESSNARSLSRRLDRLSHRCTAFRYPKSGNDAFLVELTKWAFHERSVLRAGNLRHHPPNSSQQPDRYRITDEVVFEVDIHEYRDGRWQPYK